MKVYSTNPRVIQSNCQSWKIKTQLPFSAVLCKIHILEVFYLTKKFIVGLEYSTAVIPFLNEEKYCMMSLETEHVSANCQLWVSEQIYSHHLSTPLLREP